MKILDRYILSRFLFNFISSFVILMFIFIFQAIWFFIDELAGKGLDLEIVGKFLFYYSPNLIPNVLPLTVLLASIMTFGNLAENYEFAAMKSSGISLYRAMRSLIVFMLLLSIGTFYFANDVIPRAEYKSFNLRKNIAQLKPALAITEGAFNDIGDALNIKIKEKYGENDRFLRDVIIHKKTNTGINTTVIRAKTGELVSNKGSNFLQLVLRDGEYNEDVQTSSQKSRSDYPFAKAKFEQYTMNIDLSGLNNVDLEEEKFSNLYKMQNVSQLNRSIDSIGVDNTKNLKAFTENIYNRTGIATMSRGLDDIDKDSLKNKEDVFDPSYNVLCFSPDERHLQIVNVAYNNIKNVKSTLETKKDDVFRRNKLLNYHIIALHNKFSLALACLVLFFVGAPLGAIIRKGGMGLPMVIAIGLFLSYYFLGIFTGNNAKNGSLNPLIAAWIPTTIMLPLGIMLTKRATADKGIFSLDGFIEPISKLFKKSRKNKAKDNK